ncbi:MAG: type III secretion inner membrane ring lipoprotein SctJ [Pseudomonadales bacterium]|nr:type III secretion inner membrane ring lipoprotein SctJ [Pseudomonadales bacterium]
MIMLSACNESPLYSKLTEQQANEVEAALLSANIDAHKEPAIDGEHWVISVSREEFPLSMSVLKSLGLPRTPKKTMGEIFAKKGFVSSPLEERARYLHALSEEFSTTLMEIDGVASARVHVALPDSSLLEEDKRSASVSVIIIQEPDADLTSHETDIKAIITDGVEGLDDVNKVTVKFFSRKPVLYSGESTGKLYDNS